MDSRTCKALTGLDASLSRSLRKASSCPRRTLVSPREIASLAHLQASTASTCPCTTRTRSLSKSFPWRSKRRSVSVRSKAPLSAVDGRRKDCCDIDAGHEAKGYRLCTNGRRGLLRMSVSPPTGAKGRVFRRARSRERRHGMIPCPRAGTLSDSICFRMRDMYPFLRLLIGLYSSGQPRRTITNMIMQL